MPAILRPLLAVGLLLNGGYHPLVMSDSMAIQDHLLPYHDRLEQRDPAGIQLLVIHCTELPDLATARDYGERIRYPESGTGNSGHFYVDRDGAVFRYVPVDRVAHHVAGSNANSIGIELINRGRYPDWHHSASQTMDEPYPDAQIESLVRLILRLQADLPSLRQVAGHEDLDTRRIPATDDPELTVSRKLDPGPLFPWDQVLERTGLTRIP